MARMTISTSKSKAMVLSRKRAKSPLWFTDELLTKVEFEYLRVMNDGSGRLIVMEKPLNKT